MTELKPCPICASTAVFLRDGNVWKYVECMECDYKSKAVADADVAAQAYNYRPIEDEALQHMVELDKIVGEQRLRIGALELDNAKRSTRLDELYARITELEAASYAFLEYVDYVPDPEDDSEEVGDTVHALWDDAERKARVALEEE